MFGLVLRIKGSRVLISLRCCVTATKREDRDSIHIEQTGIQTVVSALQQLPSLIAFSWAGEGRVHCAVQAVRPTVGKGGDRAHCSLEPLPGGSNLHLPGRRLWVCTVNAAERAHSQQSNNLLLAAPGLGHKTMLLVITCCSRSALKALKYLPLLLHACLLSRLHACMHSHG